jgi:hypothetical protein
MSPGPERLRTLTIFGPAGLTWKGDKAVVGLADLAGARTLLIVPLLSKKS